MKKKGLAIFIILFYLFTLRLFSEETRIDLEVVNIQIQPPNPVSGENLSVVCSIRNIGSLAVDDFKVSFIVLKDNQPIKKINDVPVLSQLPRLGSGLSVPLEIGQFKEGNYQIRVLIDELNEIHESNERNNNFVRDFRVWSRPSSHPKSYNA